MNPTVKPEEVPTDWSQNACDLINQLIVRKEENRLGKSGAALVKSHPWFDSISWEEVLNHRIKAPFIPQNVYNYYNTKYYFR
jgi:hypothetical protein